MTDEKQAKHAAKVAYCIMIAGVLTGIFWIAGAVWASIRKNEAAGTRYADHFSNIITATIVSFVMMLVGAVSILTFNTGLIVGGSVFILIAFIFAIYRMANGVSRLLDNKSFYGK